MQNYNLKLKIKNSFLLLFYFFSVFFLFSIFYFLFIPPVHGQAEETGPTTNIETYLEGFFKFENLGGLITTGVNLAMVMAALLLLGYLIWGGFDWLMSAGEKTKYEAARNKITNAILGLAIVAFAFIIWRFALYFLGFVPSLEGPIEFIIGKKE